MSSSASKFLWCSHFAVLGLGVLLGLRGNLEPKPESLPQPDLAASSSPSLKPLPELDTCEITDDFSKISTEDYAAAWDSLKGKFLPKQERLLIAKTLIQEWSAIDLEAAVHAVFAETTDEGPGQIGRVRAPRLFDFCSSGIHADPIKAWEMVRSRAFGWETSRFRSALVDCMTAENPVFVISILGELPKRERFDALDSIAESLCSADDLASQAAIWSHLSVLPVTLSDQEFIAHLAETICDETPPAELATRLLGEQKPTGRKILLNALALALFEVKEDEDFPKPLLQLPPAIRGEVAATSLRYAERDETRALALANIALDSGNLDALQAAAAGPGFAQFAGEMNQPLALVDWALRLPEDSRTLEIFRQSIQGAARHDLDGITEKLRSLQPGWHRNHGLEVLTKLEEERRVEGE